MITAPAGACRARASSGVILSIARRVSLLSFLPLHLEGDHDERNILRMI
jgi:hypothetical protein